MYCKFCGAELGEGEVICLSCGGNNAEPAKKKPVWKPILAAVCAVVLIAGIAAGVYFGLNSGFTAEEVTVKSSYTGTDEQVLSAADTVIAKAGDIELTNGELQVAYWTMVYDFLNYYGDYASYFMDLSTPLSEQFYDATNGITWEQYFLEMTLETWRRYEVLALKAEAAGVEMSESLADYFDSLYEDMDAVKGDYGFDSVADMVVNDFGVGGTFDNYVKFMRVYYYGNEYYGYLYDNLEMTETDLEAYYTENEDSFISAGYSKDNGRLVSVRHVLLQPSDDTSATDYTDQEWADCFDRIQDLQQQWLDAGGDEETFAELAMEHSACSSAADGGLIEDIMEGQMVEPFEEWIMEENRQYGDYGVVQTSYGYHLIFFVEGDELWRVVAESNLGSEMLTEILNEQEAEYPLSVNYSKIWLGEVELY